MHPEDVKPETKKFVAARWGSQVPSLSEYPEAPFTVVINEPNTADVPCHNAATAKVVADRALEDGYAASIYQKGVGWVTNHPIWGGKL